MSVDTTELDNLAVDGEPPAGGDAERAQAKASRRAIAAARHAHRDCVQVGRIE